MIVFICRGQNMKLVAVENHLTLYVAKYHTNWHSWTSNSDALRAMQCKRALGRSSYQSHLSAAIEPSYMELGFKRAVVLRKKAMYSGQRSLSTSIIIAS